MDGADFPDGLLYTKDHEWAKVEGNRVRVGITSFAVEQLGDITLVSFDAKVGDELASGKAFGTIESVKTLSDLLAPIAGKVVEINAALDKSPELVNEDCYGKAWMIVIETATPPSNKTLLDPQAYTAHVKASA
jgi:glycine cleavage system H protein